MRSACGKRAVAPRRDVRQPGNLAWNVGASDSPVAELRQIVAAPTLNGSDIEQRAGVVAARVDDGSNEARDVDGRVDRVRRRSVPDLAFGVQTPATGATRAEEGASVRISVRDEGRGRDRAHVVRNRLISEGAVAHSARTTKPSERVLWAVLSRFWSKWRSPLIIGQPKTVIGWHKQGFRLFWKRKSRTGKVGRPRIMKMK